MGLFKKIKKKGQGVKKRINENRANRKASKHRKADTRQHNRTFWDNRAKKKADRLERKDSGKTWFGRMREARQKRLETRQEGRSERKGRGQSVQDVLQGVGGVVGKFFGPDGESGSFITDTTGRMINAATNEPLDLKNNDIAIDNELNEQLNQRGVNVSKIEYMDKDNNNIDDVTGNYIMVKKEDENVLKYVWRLNSDSNRPTWLKVVAP